MRKFTVCEIGRSIKNRLPRQAIARKCVLNLPLPPSIAHRRIYLYWLPSTTKIRKTHNKNVRRMWNIYRVDSCTYVTCISI